jgi:hypothetical protein
MNWHARRGGWLAGVLLVSSLAFVGADRPAKEGEGWIDVVGPRATLDAFTPTNTAWKVVSAVTLDPKNPKLFLAEEGTGEGSIIYNGPTGRTQNIVTKEKYGDIELHIEFNVPKGSNSGVKFHGYYEIQIADSWGAKDVTASHLGGIYPRSEMKPTYHHIDKGFPPRSVASKPPGEWQTLDIIFKAPRFDASGKKVSHARIVRATVNGTVVHENVEMPYPTGDNWHQTEMAKGPLLLQADHGPVAFRNIRVRPWTPKS